MNTFGLVPSTCLGSSDGCASPDGLLLSPKAIFRVHNYTPCEGESGTPFSATIECLVRKDAVCNPLLFRLVIGKMAVTTHVKQLEDPRRFEIQADVPSIQMSGSISTIVGLIVQVIDGRGQILDSVAFGTFTYWESGLSPPSASSAYNKQENGVSLDTLPLHAPIMARTDSSASTETAVSTSSDSSGTTALSKTTSNQSKSKREMSLIRSRRRRLEKSPSSLDGSSLQSLIRGTSSQELPTSLAREKSHSAGGAWSAGLEFVTPIETLWLGWSEEEIAAGRRLVKFSQIRTEDKLLISGEAISHRDYQEGSIVISCIRRQNVGSFHITSVDVLYLVENIVGESLSTDEKNRLRRNVECYKPLTVAKNNAETKDFFHQIMDFPPPRPRNIEKDVKVFDWRSLKPALMKILSKYSSGKPQSQAAPIESLTPAGEGMKLISSVEVDTNLSVTPVDPSTVGNLSPEHETSTQPSPSAIIANAWANSGFFESSGSFEFGSDMQGIMAFQQSPSAPYGMA